MHPGFPGGPDPRNDLLVEGMQEPMAAPKKYPDELRERAVRLVREFGRPIAHITEDLEVHREALRLWVRQAEADRGERSDLQRLRGTAPTAGGE